jgi:serine/threonine protein kinase
VIELARGDVVAGCRIEAEAGRGGMGVVYRATELSLGRPVALKLIAPARAEDPGFRERFQREARLTAAIDHPNVIPVYAAGEEAGQLYLVMRFVGGTDLHRRLREDGALAPERAAELVAQTAAALDAAHAAGLVHRDVKPANVLLTVSRGPSTPT